MVNYQLFQIAKKLSSGEVLLMRATFEAHKNSDFAGVGLLGLDGWVSKIGRRLGHGLTAMVLKDERALVDQGLINPREELPLKSNNSNARLTDLGFKFCAAIEAYQIDTKVDV